MNFNFKRNRAIKIIKKALIDLQLDLCGKVILTELGSNDFLFTPLIPILANANKVYAFVKDSKYGKAEDLKKEFELHFADFEGIEKIQIFCNNLPNFCIKEADIITNSAHLRPLNASKLSLAQKNVVIPIMYEAWELRDGEIDLDFCRKNSIPLGGTNESYELTNVFNYVKVLGLKLALNAGYEIIENEIFIWSNDSFGEMLNQSQYLNAHLHHFE